MKCRFPVVVIVALGLTCGRTSNAAILLTAEEVGNDVVISGGGSLNIMGLIPVFEDISGSGQSAVNPTLGILALNVGSTGDLYAATGPSNFGSGFAFADSATGNNFGTSFNGNVPNGSVTNRLISLPANYISGTELSATVTFLNSTFASIGLVEGSYTWTLETQDTFTLEIGPGSNVVPEPTTMTLFSMAILAGGVCFTRKRLRRNSAGQ